MTRTAITAKNFLSKHAFKYLLILIVVLTATNRLAAQNINPADKILGKWISVQKNVIVDVYQYDKDKFGAKLIWFDDSDDRSKPMNTRTDYKNPDEALRNRKLIGMQVLEGLAFDPETGTWENGMIYDAKSGRTWNSAAYIVDNNLLKVSGYWHFKFLGKSMVFKRL